MPSLFEWHQGLVSHSAEETERFAAELVPLLPINTTLALHGDLGAGKTTFVRGFARALGIKSPITSPTYSIFSIYETATRQLVHMDAYRLTTPADADNLVLWDLLYEPWTLAVEWPEKMGDRLPAKAWHLEFSFGEDESHHIRLLSEL